MAKGEFADGVTKLDAWQAEEVDVDSCVFWGLAQKSGRSGRIACILGGCSVCPKTFDKKMKATPVGQSSVLFFGERKI